MITGGKSLVSSPPAFSNDEKRLLVCTGNIVSIFSVSTGLQTSELKGHGSLVTSVIVVPASTSASKALCYCWTSSLDGSIKYWDFVVPELMRSIDIRFPIHSMVIPSLLNQATEINGKLPDLIAYVYTEDKKNKKDKHGQIRKCNLTKSRLVAGLTLAETKKPGCITVGPLGKYIGIYKKKTLRIWEIPRKDSDHVSYKQVRLRRTEAITALAFHPTDRVVAAGDHTGRISIWRDVGRKAFSNGDKLIGLDNDTEERDVGDADPHTTWHWHSAKVNVLFFSSDGAYLYSGGKEGVLVVWQLDTGKKKFLPRIGSPLKCFVNSADPSLASISCEDNRIHLLRMPSMEIMRSISGIKLPSDSLKKSDGFVSGVVFNRTSGLIAVPTENYRVQFYNLFDDREISEIQICERNHQPVDETTVRITFVALSPDGSTMSTVETRSSEEGIGGLVSLKFWASSPQNKEFTLSTVIYEPHREADISSIAFHPRGHKAVTSSNGGDFKVWAVESHEDQTLQNIGWTCHAVRSYYKKAMTAAAFSGDGSVLAVAADNIITLWNPDNILVAVIGESFEPITNLAFVGESEFLVSASRGSNPQVTLWSMSKLSTCWSYRLHVEAISCSMNDSTFAVLGSSKGVDGVILLFNVENPVPLSTWFVSKAKGGGLSFVQSSPILDNGDAETKTGDEVLAYVNGDHEYVLFNPHDEQANTSISRQKNSNNLNETERFGYSSIYGELPEFSMEIDGAPLQSMPSETAWKSIFSGPSHSLPPLPKLCASFLESLLERRTTAVE